MPLFGILAGLLILCRGANLFFSNWDYETIALTHLITLGWLAMAMIGAYYQMVPVLVGGHVPYIHLSRLTHAGFVIGVLFLVAGLYFFSPVLLAIATILLALSFLVFIVQLSMAVFRVAADRPTVLAMRVSLISLILAVALGIMFAGGYASWWDQPFERSVITGIHLTLGLFGWVGCLIMGVGFHVIPMFYITAPFPRKRAKGMLLCQISSLIVLPCFLLAEMFDFWIIAAGLPGFAGMLIFVFTIYELIHKRTRKVVDSTIRFWQVGLGSLVFSLVFLGLFQWYSNMVFVFLFGVLFLVGFAACIINGMLYKIVPFMIWFHRFSSLIGKANVPTLRDICPDKAARRQWKLFMGALFSLLIGVAGGVDPIIRAGGLVLMISSAFLFFNLYKAASVQIP